MEYRTVSKGNSGHVDLGSVSLLRFYGVETALSRVALFEPFLKEIPQLFVADQTPCRTGMEPGWGLSCEAFDDQIGT